jgi:PAS domain S-box-containing protein
MRTIPKGTNKKQRGISKKTAAATTDDTLRHLAFDNTVQANIISTVSSGKIIMANSAACKLLGYSKKQLLSKSRKDIFDIKETGFKKMLKERTAEGQSIALVTAIKKSGKQIPCEITSAVFLDEDGIEESITTIADISQNILKQKNIDTEKERIVADNIVLAKSKQKKIDNRKEKIVAGNIIVALKKSDSRLEENNEWIKYIAKASYDVMWDWDITTGEIYVGDSIAEVFGYRLQNNTVHFADFSRCLLPAEKDKVEKNLWKTLNSHHKSWNDSYMFKRQDGSVASTTCRASIVRDEAGKAIRLIGAIQDVSMLQELEKKLREQTTIQEEQSEKFFLAAKLSFDVIWDWNLLTNELYMGEGFEELFGYTLKNNKGNITDWGNHLHPDDKEAIEEGLHAAIASTAVHWEQAYRFIRADGSVAKVFDRASIIRHADGKAYRMIGAIQDLSRQKELEERLDHEIAAKGNLLTEYRESFKLIFNSSSDVLYDVDLITGRVIISDAFEKEFGYKITSNMTPAESWLNHIHPDDKEAVMKDYLRVLASDATEWKYSYRFLRADNSVANVSSNRIILRNADGKAYRILGSMHDISKQKVLEEKLAQEIKLKENQIVQATEEAKETERSDIGKELHDNVNQLLGASRMYLELAKQGGENSEMFLSRSSEYTLTAINEIRKLTKGLTTDIVKDLGLCDAIDNVAQDMMEVNPVKIICTLDHFIEDRVNDKFKLNVFRMVQEQLNNILKHAKASKVDIGLFQNKKTIMLTISDNGVGFDTRKKRKGIGVDNIKSRAASFKGTADFVSQPGQGCVLTVTFPVTNTMLNKN